MKHPDYIAVSHTERTVVEADRADIFLRISGSSLFYGQAALSQAREVAELVARLKAYGIQEAQIRLQSVQAQTSGSTLSRSSSATYSLRIEDVKLDQIADVTGFITERKNATFDHLTWRYPPFEPMMDEMRLRCLEGLRRQAKQIVEGLQVKLLGVWELDEQRNEEFNGHSQVFRGLAEGTRARRITQDDFGLEISHTQELTLTLKAKFRISAFEE